MLCTIQIPTQARRKITMTNNNDTRTNYDTVQTRETSSSNMYNNTGNDDDGRSSDRRRAGTTQTPRLTTSTYIFAACAALNSCNLGYDIGVSTNAGGIIQRDLGLTDVQRELFIGSLNFWSIFGSLGSFWISDCYGRRKSFQVAAMLFIVGCSIMAAAQSYAVLMLGRFFLGIGVGFGLAIDPLYISEITPASHRGEIVTWSEIAINVGVVLGFCSGIIFYDVDDSLEWRLMFLMGCILPLIVILVSQYIMPESPRWLVSKNRTEEAKVILRNIYPNNQHQQIETVIRDIQEALQRERLAENTMGWTMLLCPTPAIRRMLLVGIGMAISQQAVGIDAIQYYLIEIIASAGMESDKAQLGVLIILGVLKLMFVVIASKVVDKRGRKPLLLLSLAGMCGACIMISFSFLGNEDENNASTRSAFTILGLSLYLSFFSIGMGPIAWLVPSEIFATSIRAKAMSVAVFSNRIVATVMASTFLSTANAIGWGAFFLVLAAIAVVVAIFVYFVLPETKGRSLEDMSIFFAEITNDTSILEAEKQIIESRSGDFECNNNINIRRRSNVVEMKDLQQQITISSGELT